ncbi:MAG TPA: outer membrane beta-barrel protein [Saprospiraceae bacterium]|nr:outer membrane beta-barrel protein [Saprospiraceae bacterium]HMP23224.1 outer membrane beta-barrel protein [Saprospiraceae bacterium]
MPDNRLDEQFVNHAWEQMQQLLDQEMPVQEKRRRGAFWWWLLPLFLLGVSAGSIWWWHHHQDTPPALPAKAKPQPNTPVAQAPAAQETSSSVGTTTSRNASSGHAPAKPNTEVMHVPSVPLVESSAVHPNEDQPTDNSSSAGEAGIKTDLPTASNQEATTANSRLLTDTPDASAPMLKELPDETTVSSTPAPMTYNWLPTNTPQLLLRTATPEPIMVQPHPQVSNWRWGATTGFQLRNAIEPSGYTAGLVLDVPLRGRQWVLQTGANWIGQRRPIERQESEMMQAERVGNEPVFGPSAVPQPAEPVAFSMTARQLAVPFAFVYRPTARWGLEAGWQTAYLLQVSRLEGERGFLSRTDNSPITMDQSTVRNFLYNFADAPGNRLKISETRRVEMSALLGVHWYPSERWSWRLQYQHGMTDMIKNPNFQSFNRRVQLSAVRYFR